MSTFVLVMTMREKNNGVIANVARSQVARHWLLPMSQKTDEISSAVHATAAEATLCGQLSSCLTLTHPHRSLLPDHCLSKHTPTSGLVGLQNIMRFVFSTKFLL